MTPLVKIAQQLSEAQKEAGNYKKGHRKIAGMHISIENPAGSIRSGTAPDGTSWSTVMKSHYGYIKGTVGRDKDHVDCFIKKGTMPTGVTKVFIVNQVDPGTKEFDEHKVMIGWDTKEEAKAGYYENYDDGWQGLGNIVEVDMDVFKDWVKDTKATKKPCPSNQQSDSDDIIGVDLDGTLAKHSGWKGPTIIGDPIPTMVKRVKKALFNGKKVQIITARVAPGLSKEERKRTIKAIEDWCEEHIGQRLPITAVKGRDVKELWDDRAIQVVRNTGRKIRKSLRTNLEKTSSEDEQGKSSTRDESPLTVLKQLKAESDRHNYSGKQALFLQLYKHHPDDFVVDSTQDNTMGITHAPTGFQFHMPKEKIPMELRTKEIKNGR